MTDRLREALKGTLNAFCDGIDGLAAAALALVDAEEVWWCEEHGQSGSNDYCWPASVRGDTDLCRMVTRLLVDPEKLL